MAEEYVGAVVLEWNGKEIECISINTQAETGKRIVKTMNRKARAKGHAQGVATFSLDVEVAIPRSGDLDWMSMEDGKITVFPVDDEGKRETYYGCAVESMSSRYQVDNHAVRSLKITALDMKLE